MHEHAEYIPREQWPEYLVPCNVPPEFHAISVGTNPKGARWGIWFLYCEEYVSDAEPDLSNAAHEGPNRIIVWRRITRQDIPPGWYQLSRTSIRREGYARVPATGAYNTQWSDSARRYRNKWQREYAPHGYRIEEISYAEFEEAYKRSTVVKKMELGLLNIVKRKLEAGCAPHIRMWGVRHPENGAVIAGLAVVNSPTTHASYYACGFMLEAFSKTPCMVALMDHWFRWAQEQDITVLHFGQFWTRGAPRSWKGFSSFKEKFTQEYIDYPPALIRFQRGTWRM